MPARGTSWYVGLVLFVAALASLAGLFYFGGFTRLLSDQSSSFQVELGRTQSRAHRDATVVVLGNSTAAEGFRANFFHTRSAGVVALNLAVPSGHIYLFERMLAIAQREGVRPRTVVLMLTPEMLSLRKDFDFLLNDLTILKTEIDSSDFVRLASHTADPRHYARYASPVAVRPVLYRAEMRDLLAHPRERIENAERLQEWLAGFGPQSEMLETNNTFSVCDAGKLSKLEATVKQMRRENSPPGLPDLERVLAGYAARVHQPLAIDPFEAKRFEHMLRALASTGAKVYLVEAPYYDPEFDQYSAGFRTAAHQAFERAAAAVPGVSLLPAFSADCSMMLDTVHLNRKGGEQFTEYLRTRVL